MNFLDKLNLRPQERRLVVGIMLVVFVVINVLLVWPYFGEWSKVRADLNKTRDDLFKYNRKIAQATGANSFESQLKKLEGENSGLVTDQQEIQLLRIVQSKVAENKLMVSRYDPIPPQNSGQTNEFFEEQSIKINVNAGEKELVNFLLSVGSDSSMIRVRDLDLKPADQNRYKLQGSITLSANYQKKTPAKPAVAGARPAAAMTPVKPASPPSNSTVKKP
ncbi:MAG: hypothetical protein ABJC04_01695 [Verrucomicrobiota bacterium]